jgi:hypothetical protein
VCILDPEHHLHISIGTHPDSDFMDVLVAAKLSLVLHNYEQGKLGIEEIMQV